jgi:sporulation protein YlmC with PRC-barrel domain
MLNKMVLMIVILSASIGVAHAQQTTQTGSSQAQGMVLNSLPQNASTVTDWYKQDVFDKANSRVGSISDVLVGHDGKIEAFIISVGGFLGIAVQKDVAVPFEAVKMSKNSEGRIKLTMDTTKDALKDAPGYKYDAHKSTWTRS